MLRTALAQVSGRVLNVDATLICEQPRLGPHRAEMERKLAEVLSARVSVKATSNEGMGFIGRGEGVACLVVAALESD
jgi:2-C-methyl-D-erythritol 4-phosphate cytidylyltransferase/2-C-methyl-D-erythritol 2,4-cyclodiphosphate synthase